MSTGFQLPGAFWVALITAIIGLLQGDWFAGQEWVAGVVILLGAVAKIVELYVKQQQETNRGFGERSTRGQRVSRWLFG